MTQITLEANQCWLDTSENNFKDKNLNDKFGIYILGIKSNHDEGRILPYYVGKSETLIRARVKSHVNKILSPCTTYTIFSNHFLFEKRGTPMDFIKRIKLPSEQYCSSNYSSDILYLNERKFFKKLWSGDPKLKSFAQKWPSKPFPLCLLDLSGMKNELLKINFSLENTYSKGSLYFTMISTGLGRNKETLKKDKEILEFLETYIKFSLKINTIGLSKEYFELATFLENHQVALNIKYPVINQEFHPDENRPTNVPSILFP